MIEQGRQHLQSYLGELLDAIVRSAPACPPLIRAAFRQLFQRVGERFPQHQVGLCGGCCGVKRGHPQGTALSACAPQCGQRGPLLGKQQPRPPGAALFVGLSHAGRDPHVCSPPLGGPSTPNLWLSPASCACASSRRP